MVHALTHQVLLHQFLACCPRLSRSPLHLPRASPALRRIMHNGGGSDVTGLGGFENVRAVGSTAVAAVGAAVPRQGEPSSALFCRGQVVRSLANDPYFRDAQDKISDQL